MQGQPEEERPLGVEEAGRERGDRADLDPEVPAHHDGGLGLLEERGAALLGVVDPDVELDHPGDREVLSVGEEALVGHPHLLAEGREGRESNGEGDDWGEAHGGPSG
ncbi:MAG: hypothetical protein H6730_08560 [Deltaproteobacteria bacterium]|nr:hypothetical protein [Deltaproteobacteria bacterium]